MNISIRSRLVGEVPARVVLVGTVLVLGFGAMGATAQTATPTPAPALTTPNTTDATPAPTNAQLQAENQKLRLQLAQLKEAQKTPSDAPSQPKDKMGMAKPGEQKCCKGMPDSGAAKDTPDKSMKKDGMGMMEKEHSMGMPAPNTDAPQDPPMKDH
jgi:hypothetical protein